MQVNDYLSRCERVGDHLIWPGAVTSGVPTVGTQAGGTKSLRRLAFAHYAGVDPLQLPGQTHMVVTTCGCSRCLDQACLALVDRSTGLEVAVNHPAPVRSVFELAKAL